jgi:hypothetical protein
MTYEAVVYHRPLFKEVVSFLVEAQNREEAQSKAIHKAQETYNGVEWEVSHVSVNAVNYLDRNCEQCVNSKMIVLDSLKFFHCKLASEHSRLGDLDCESFERDYTR